MKKISIIVCCYNQGQYLKECLDGAFNQTYNNIEVVLVNDGSTDNTHEVAQQYTNKSNFIYIKQDNKGLGIARNNGIKKSTGELTFILDSDDVLRPDYLKEAFNLLEDDNTVVWPIVSYFYNENIEEPFEVTHLPTDRNTTMEDELSEFSSFVSLLTTKDNFIKSGLYLTERRYMQITDYDMSLKLRGLGCKFITLRGEKLFYYRQHDKAMTVNNWWKNSRYYYNLLKYKLHEEKYSNQIKLIFLEILKREPTHIEFMHYFEKLENMVFSFSNLRDELTLLINYDMRKLNVIKDFTDVFELKFDNILDIGAGNGEFANALCHELKIKKDKIYTYEPNEKLYNTINEKHPEFNNNKKAVFIKEGKSHFNLVNNHDGISSLYFRDVFKHQHPSTSTEVETTTGINIVNEIKNSNKRKKNFNFLALIDACGTSHEILSSFGESLNDIGFLCVATESEEMYAGQKQNEEVKNFLVDNGFIFIHSYSEYPNEHTSFFLNNKFL
jgi:FkbM family methyltransferase